MFLLALVCYAQITLVNCGEVLDEMHSKMAKAMAPFSDAIPAGLSDAGIDLPGAKKPKNLKVMDAINAYRAKICADMQDDHGAKFASYEACDDFMTKACHPGKDRKMDGDSKEVTTTRGHCNSFFDSEDEDKDKEKEKQREKEKNKKKKEEEEKEQREKEKNKKKKEEEEKEKARKAKTKQKVEAIHADSEEEEIVEEAEKVLDGEAPSPAPAGGEKKKAAGGGEKAAGGSPAPAGASPAPGPAGARPTLGDTVEVLDTKHTQDKFPEGIGKEFAIKTDLHNAKPYQLDGNKQWFYEGDVRLIKRKVHAPDEKWYYKNGGVDVGRYHMDEKLKLPAQGYWGKLVEHQDGETSVGDWQHEFAGADGSKEKICESHPENIWCQERFNYRSKKSQRSRAAQPMISNTILTFALACICAVGSL